MRKEEKLHEWFKCLPPHRRIDYMCGLLRLCLPLELRFLGSVLEDLAKKDFLILRDQENKANQRANLSANNSSSLCDKNLRAKMITALALMNSSNSTCAQVIFDIIAKQDLDNLSKVLTNNSFVAADLIVLFTMAVNHPAFTFYQRNQLVQVLNRIQRYTGESPGDDFTDDGDDLENLHMNTCQVLPGYYQTGPVQQDTETYVRDCSCAMSHTPAVNLDSTTSSSSNYNCQPPATNSDLAADRTFQLLHLLNLIDDYDRLKECSLQQIIHMSREFRKSDLPPEVEARLRSSLSQRRSHYMNGVAEAGKQPGTPAVFCHQPLTRVNSHHYVPHFLHVTGHRSPASGHTSMSRSPKQPPSARCLTHTGSLSSPGSVNGPSRRLDPSHLTGHVPSAVALHIMTPIADTQTGSHVNMNYADSSSSEDEIPTAEKHRYRRHGTTHQSQSLANISLPREAATRASMCLPTSHAAPSFIAAVEPGISTTVPAVPAVEGSTAYPHMFPSHAAIIHRYLSEPPPHVCQGTPVIGLSEPPPHLSRGTTVIGSNVVLSSVAFKAMQPVHCSLNCPAMSPLESDVQQPYANADKSSAIYSGVPGIPRDSPFHCCFPLRPADDQVSNTAVLLSSPERDNLHVTASQLPAVTTTVANSMPLMTTAPPPTLDNSASEMSGDKRPCVIDTCEFIRVKDSSACAPIQISDAAADTMPSSTSRPNPPSSHKQTEMLAKTRRGSEAQVLGYINGLVPVIYSGELHQQPKRRTTDHHRVTQLASPSHWTCMYPTHSTHISPVNRWMLQLWEHGSPGV